MSSIRIQARELSLFNGAHLLALAMVLIFSAPSRAEEKSSITEQIAKTYGLDSFWQIEAIRYTWSAELPDGRKPSRTWQWSPKTDTVSYEGKDKEGKPVKATYQRSQLSSQSDAIKKEIDPTFANDQYWLLLPFYIVWDGAIATDDGTHKLPIGDGSVDRIVVKYPSEGGYQHGDTWELYVGADKRIEEVTYNQGAANPPHLVSAKYANYKKAGPLLIATDIPGVLNGKPIRISITDLSVKLTGSDNWITAQ